MFFQAIFIDFAYVRASISLLHMNVCSINVIIVLIFILTVSTQLQRTMWAFEMDRQTPPQDIKNSSCWFYGSNSPKPSYTFHYLFIYFRILWVFVSTHVHCSCSLAMFQLMEFIVYTLSHSHQFGWSRGLGWYQLVYIFNSFTAMFFFNSVFFAWQFLLLVVIVLVFIAFNRTKPYLARVAIVWL